MTDDAPTPAVTRIRRVLSVLLALATFIGNVIPLYGVLYWQWDTFQLLMLYWMETAVIAFWTMMRLARLDAADRGEITVNGKRRAASRVALVGFFAFHASAFILVHLLFLWLFFSGEWLKKVHGFRGFFYELLGANYVWVALVFLMIASAVSFLIDSRLRHAPPGAAAGTVHAGNDAVGAIVGGLYARIVIMQIAIIFGAMISGFAGSTAPIVIVIVLKMLIDLGLSGNGSITRNVNFSSNIKKLKIEM